MLTYLQSNGFSKTWCLRHQGTLLTSYCALFWVFHVNPVRPFHVLENCMNLFIWYLSKEWYLKVVWMNCGLGCVGSEWGMFVVLKGVNKRKNKKWSNETTFLWLWLRMAGFCILCVHLWSLIICLLFFLAHNTGLIYIAQVTYIIRLLIY